MGSGDAALSRFATTRHPLRKHAHQRLGWRPDATASHGSRRRATGVQVRHRAPGQASRAGRALHPGGAQPAAATATKTRFLPSSERLPDRSLFKYTIDAQSAFRTHELNSSRIRESRANRSTHSISCIMHGRVGGLTLHARHATRRAAPRA